MGGDGWCRETALHALHYAHPLKQVSNKLSCFFSMFLSLQRSGVRIGCHLGKSQWSSSAHVQEPGTSEAARG